MNKKYFKNETKQSTRKRENRPVSRDSASTRRQVRTIPVTNLESGISFLVNESSTNLNRKIELELARLDSVEKKIRKHKCKTTAVTSTKTPSSNPSNQRKLRNILESMLATIDYTPQKIKKYSPYQQKLKHTDFESADAVRKCVKQRKIAQHPKKVESFTNIFNNTNRKAIKTNFPKTDNVYIKSALKKPMSAPNETRNNVFSDDLKFAESLRNGKHVDLEFMIDDMKKMVQLPTNNRRQVSNHEFILENNSRNVKFDNGVRNNFKVIIEQPSQSNFSYIYDSPFSDCSLVDKPIWPNDSTGTQRKISPYGSKVKISKSTINKTELNSKEVEYGDIVEVEEPEEKEFYSYLRRGNFIISGHMDEDNGDDEKEHISEVDSEEITARRSIKTKNSEQGRKMRIIDIDKVIENQRLENSLGLTEEAVQVPMSNKPSESKSIFSEKKDLYSHVCDFPIDLFERSILAVENVLNTIDSIANEFSQSTEIKDPLPAEVETLNAIEDLLVDTSMDKFLKKLSEDELVDSQNNGNLQDTPDGDQHSNGKKNSSVMKTKHMSSNGSFSVSKPTVLCSGDSNSVQGLSKISQDSAKNNGNSFSPVLSQNDILCLKPPVKQFLNSEENFPDALTSRYSMLTEKTGLKEKWISPKKQEYVAGNDDDIDPLMVALESLRTRVNAIEEEIIDVSPKLSIIKLRGNVAKCATNDLPGRLYTAQSRHRTSVKEAFISQTISETSCHSFATSQSDNNFTLNHSYSFSCSSNGSRASSCRKLFIPPNSSSKMFNRPSNRIFSAGRNRGNNSQSGSCSVRRNTSKIFPDYYIDRCMKLLGKKFKDFDKLRRQKVFDKKSDETMKSYTLQEPEKDELPITVTSRIENRTTPKGKKSFYEKTEMLWINNTKENYKVCFKNEHFNNRSETSIESHSKEVTSVAKKKNVYTISRIKSSP